MSLNELCNLTLTQAQQALCNSQTSSEALTQACLAQIKKHDDDIGAFLFVNEQSALQQAQASDLRRQENKLLSPIDGIPLALKDNILALGTPTTAASKSLEGYDSTYNATVTQKLLDAGAVILGKLNLDEFAMGSSNENSGYQVCKNPWDANKAPGGSSGGAAAAVAAGMCFGALGTDTGGSIRQPASFCGVTGLKPTYGRISRFGVVAYGSSLDQVGPLTRDVQGAALLYETISGFDPRDATSLDRPVEHTPNQTPDTLKGLRIGLPKEFNGHEGLSTEVQNVLNETREKLSALGASFKEVSLPHTDYAIATYYIVATAEAASNLARYDGIRYGPRKGQGKDLETLYAQTRGQLLGKEVKRRILLGNYVLSAGYYDAYYLKALKARRRIADDFEMAFQSVDLILCPTAPTPAFGIGEKTSDPLQMYLSDIFTISCNLAGIPGLSVNAGFCSEGLPIGMQLLGPAFSEKRILETAKCLETSLGIQDKRPLLQD